jgi:hypothetical protein
LTHGEPHTRADLFDDAGSFMPEQHRHRSHAVAVDDREIRVTHARRLDADEHLALARWLEVDLTYGEWSAAGVRRRVTNSL